MIPPNISGSVLLPVKEQLTAATLSKYRELIRNLRTQNSEVIDESSNLFQQAKNRVVYRLEQKRELLRADPKGAVRRFFTDRLAVARSSWSQLKQEQEQKLQQYYKIAIVSNQRLIKSKTTTTQHVEKPLQSSITGTDGLLRSVVLAGIGGACKLFLNAAANTTVSGGEVFKAALERPDGQGLITVSNHVAALDDPIVTSAIIPTEYLLKPKSLRWTLCATDRCFKHAAIAPFFRAAKVLPVERGAGVSQFGMQVAGQRLDQGDWIHIFPEGTRSGVDGKMLPMRRGIGWLAASCEKPPLIVPFVHSGMEQVMPRGQTLPKLGRDVQILVGEPISITDLLDDAKQQQWTEQKLHSAIAKRVGQVLYSLKAQLDRKALQQVMPESSAVVMAINEDTLLPLIEEEMDSLRHRWKKRWDRLKNSAWADSILHGKHNPNYNTTTISDEDNSSSSLSHSNINGRSEQHQFVTPAAITVLRGSLLGQARKQTATTPNSSLAKSNNSTMLTRTSSRNVLSEDAAHLALLFQGVVDYSSMRVQRMRNYMDSGNTNAAAGKTAPNEPNFDA